ncbi:MAG: GntR family transcriptional regulator [Phycisphaeraceae bacterium]|nr:GntR family transcriptional regulator [Phycisphaeraceae bacterium]
MRPTLRITPGSTVPIYRQIVDQVRMAVAAGTLKRGDRLPSVRALAERLVVNPNTVARAYQELSRNGLIESQHGRGVFVAKARQLYSRAERMRRLDRAIDVLLGEILTLEMTPEEIRTALDRRLKQLAPD